jgi:hypothetical protein
MTKVRSDVGINSVIGRGWQRDRPGRVPGQTVDETEEGLRGRPHRRPASIAVLMQRHRAAQQAAADLGWAIS